MRVTYALYNGGPRNLERYGGRRPNRAFQRIADVLLERYDRVRAGRELEVASCWGFGNPVPPAASVTQRCVRPLAGS